MRWLVLLLLLLPVAALAHDPFTGLTAPNRNGLSCCSSEGPSGDCKPTITRFEPGSGKLQARIDERWSYYGIKEPQWVTVPDDAILPIEKNPVAGEVVCWAPSFGVICYLPGRGT